MSGSLSSVPGITQSNMRTFYPSHTVRCLGLPVFSSQLSRDVGCLLDVDDDIESWSCSPRAFRQGVDIHYPTFFVERRSGASVINICEAVQVPPWMKDEATKQGLLYETISRRDIPAIRLKNAKDLLRYARYEVGLDDRIRLLAALDENGSLVVSECMSAFRSVAPVPGLASLILNRFVTVDLDEAPIGPETIVRRFRG